MSKKTCPLCKRSLSLKQVNFNLAVYICEDLKCKYPVGCECIVVERKLENMNKNLENETNGKDLDDWIDNVVNLEESTSNSVTVPPNGEVPAETSANGVEWIDDLVEEAVSAVKRQEMDKSVTVEGYNSNTTTFDTDFDDILNFISNG